MKWTNVLEIFSRLECGDEQIRYYKNGVGASDQSLHAWSITKFFDNTVDLAIAWYVPLLYVHMDISFLKMSRNVAKGIQHAYHWLSERYKPGDRIFLFGM